MKAWLYQDDKQVKKHGTNKSSWYVGWIDPAGKRRCKSCGAGRDGKRAATILKRKIEGQLVTGSYESDNKSLWVNFRDKFEAKIVAGMEPATREATLQALNHFQRIIKPIRMKSITSLTIVDYVAARRDETTSKNSDRTIAKATINKELRHLRAVLRKAARWDYLPAMPEIDFLKVTKKLPTYVPPEDFAKLYHACTVAKFPASLPNVSAADWWKALLILAYMTGWRIGQIIALKWADVDLDAGTAITKGDSNKGKRDEKIAIAEVIVTHLRKLQGSFDPCVFPWNNDRRMLWVQFQRIQKAAGTKPEGGIKCYGFHDLRRAFATLNEERLTPMELQAMMQHQSFETTKNYISMARKMKVAASKVFEPDLSKNDGTG